MSRHLKDWLLSYVDYASYTEAPKIMHYWSGVSAIAGALRRKVWIDQTYFRWYPSFYIVFVAPPGVVSKSTTADISMSILREVPGIHFGPDIVTWQALVTAFAAAQEPFQIGDAWHVMSPITLVASELGNLIDPQNRELINLFITLWDGRNVVEKVTKTSGSDTIEAPWINMIGCTTPSWMEANVPEVAIGGGFTSRCVFVYVDTKEKLVPYPKRVAPINGHSNRKFLLADLEHIATNLAGEYVLDGEAEAWGSEWYNELWTNRPTHLEEERLAGYVARKQTHLHKLAMVIAASKRDELVIMKQDLIEANVMLTSLETDLISVFACIGRSKEATAVRRLESLLKRRGKLEYSVAYRYVQDNFPNHTDYEGIVAGLLRSRKAIITTEGNTLFLVSAK